LVGQPTAPSATVLQGLSDWLTHHPDPELEPVLWRWRGMDVDLDWMENELALQPVDGEFATWIASTLPKELRTSSNLYGHLVSRIGLDQSPTTNTLTEARLALAMATDLPDDHRNDIRFL